MTLDEIFEQDQDAGVPDDFPELVIDVPIELLRSTGCDLNEGRWTRSDVKGIYQRIDPERSEMKQRRHVHLASKKHLSATTQQVSWNDDGSRHDRHKFNAKLGQRDDYRTAARLALGLDPGTVLEQMTGSKPAERTLLNLYESWAGPPHHRRVFLTMK
ncbi:hypothetical protein FV218_10965 [Methylobacterium sp. WL69]|uniref:DUF6367 family protein n=1 Tax=Methylobacterium sp. WL69 TaxID=2603893 RepID=UPI0011C9B854|nr:DUF6367 family protein [Methylobacterium sp. WL69]TXM73727.1 hypothetical protein FV218_10965 [Methylobacterium sp. WL69]